MDQALNIAFFVFHSAWIVFVCTGWIWRRTRPWQLAAVALTAASWFVLGFRYGWGYCPFTDWHWQIRARLGFIDPPSYIQLLIRELSGVELRPVAADALAVVTLVVAAGLGVARRFAIGGRGESRLLMTLQRGTRAVGAPAESATSMRIMPSCREVSSSSPSPVGLMCRSAREMLGPHR